MAANAMMKHHPFDLFCLFFVSSGPIFEPQKHYNYQPSFLRIKKLSPILDSVLLFNVD